MPKVPPITITDAVTRFVKLTPQQTTYNKAGNRLVATGSFLRRKRPKGLDIPNNVYNVTIADVESEFGKIKTRIISLFSKDKKLVTRFQIVDTEGTQTITHSRYTTSADVNQLNEDVKLFDIKRLTMQNGKTIKKDRTMLTLPEDKSADITLSRLTSEQKDSKLEFEIQTIESYKQGSPKNRKFLTTEGYHNKDGNVFLTNLYSNIENAEQFIKDPYIMTRMYPNEDFVKSTTSMFFDKFGLAKDDTTLKFQCSRYTRGAYDHKKSLMTIDPFYPKPYLVNTTSHETRHIKQHQYIDDLNIAKANGNVSTNLKKSYIKIAKRFKIAEKLYWTNLGGMITPLYLGNKLEKDANKIAQRWKKHYERLSENLHKEFPQGASEQFGMNYSDTIEKKSKLFSPSRSALFRETVNKATWG